MRSFREFFENGVQLVRGERSDPAAFLRASVGKLIYHRSSWLPTMRAIYRQMITPIGFALKERAPMLDKFVSKGFGRKLAVKFAVALFKFGVFCLQVFYLLFESLRLVREEGNPLAKDRSAAVLGNEGLDVGEKSHSDLRDASDA